MATTPNFSFLESILENLSLAAKKEIYPALSHIGMASEGFSTSFLQTLGVILIFFAPFNL